MASGIRQRQRSPYPVEDITIRIQRSRLGAAWRWRTELLALVLVLAAWRWLTGLMGGWLWGGLLFLGILAVLLAVPWTRRFLAVRFWCLVTRHRLQRVFWETRLHTRAGHLPLIYWMHATPTGERAFVLARAGTCVADFEDAVMEFAAACGAREARVTGSARWSQLVTIDILRRDLLEPRRVVGSDLLGMVGPVLVPVPRDDPGADTGPAWPEIEPGETRS